MMSSNTGTFHRKVLKNTPWERAKMNYSIMALHTRYNRKEMKNVMGPDTKYITMLRDPVDLFESAYVYYRMISSYNMTLGKSRDAAASLFKKTKKF